MSFADENHINNLGTRRKTVYSKVLYNNCFLLIEEKSHLNTSSKRGLA